MKSSAVVAPGPNITNAGRGRREISGALTSDDLEKTLRRLAGPYVISEFE